MGIRRALIVAGVAALAVLVGACDWSSWRFDSAHTGYNPNESAISTTNVSTLTTKWTGTTSGAFIASSPAIAGGKLYVGSNDGKLYVFNASDQSACVGAPKVCAPLWTASLSGSAYRSSPAVSNGVVYIGDQTRLYAFDAAGVAGCGGTPKTCQPLWTSLGGESFVTAPTVANGVVYAGSQDHVLYAFDAAGSTGCSGSPKRCTALWTAVTGASIDSSPAVAGGIVYVGSDNLYAFDAAGSIGCAGTPKSCNPLWMAQTGSLITSSPAISNGILYVGSYGGKLSAIDATGGPNCTGFNKTCPALWTADIAGSVSSPAIANGAVYVGGKNLLYAFDASGSTGCAGSPKVCIPIWTAPVSGGDNPYDPSPAVANGVVYAGSGGYNGAIYAFDAAGSAGCAGSPKTCAPLWSFAGSGWQYSSPSVANGVVYSAWGNGAIYAFGL